MKTSIHLQYALLVSKISLFYKNLLKYIFQIFVNYEISLTNI